MILQCDPRFPTPLMATQGCHIMVPLWYANKLYNVQLSPALIDSMVLYLQQTLSKRNDLPCIAYDLAVNDHDSIADYFGIPVIKDARFAPTTYRCAEGEYEILLWRHGAYSHATAGNGSGVVTYDPLGESHTVAQGVQTAKIILTWGRGLHGVVFDKGRDQKEDEAGTQQSGYIDGVPVTSEGSLSGDASRLGASGGSDSTSGVNSTGNSG